MHLLGPYPTRMIEVYKEKFRGNKAALNGPELDAIHVAPAASEKAKGKAPGPAEDTGPKAAEVLAWEEKTRRQGDIVRELKAEGTKSAEDQAEITNAVDELRLKVELASYQQETS